MTKVGDVWYRIEDHLVSAGLDEFDNPLGPPRLQVSIRKFPVAKVTLKGVWLDRSFMGKRFVLFKSRKRYACATLELALESFQARKRKQIRIYRARVRHAEEALLMAEYEVTGQVRNIPAIVDVRLPSTI
jgi:hypothetical protein